MYDWIMTRRASEIKVPTSNIIAKPCSFDPLFKGSCDKNLRHLVYPFLNPWKLNVRKPRSVGQKLSGDLLSVWCELVKLLMYKFTFTGSYSCAQPKMFVRTDESAVHSETKPLTTVHCTGSNSVSIRCSSSNARRPIVCVSVVIDGKKLPFFLIFKGAPNDKIEKN